jgi:CBS domain containing-hemolysin-like protein
VAAVLLAVAIVVPLLIGVYDREDPTLFGFPFFYWFQFLLIPLTSVLTWIAFKVLTPSDRERSRAAGGEHR